uniref:(northern house mosquito) hypothetical protein n=1 Tax=Culex pipiens TaxID=7175 RepID=A0A8D8ADG9_CULPI
MVRWEELTPTRRVAQKTQLARTYVTGSDAPQVATHVEVGSPSTHAQTAAETLPNSEQLQVLAQSSPTERTNPNGSQTQNASDRQHSQHSPEHLSQLLLLLAGQHNSSRLGHLRNQVSQCQQHSRFTAQNFTCTVQDRSLTHFRMDISQESSIGCTIKKALYLRELYKFNGMKTTQLGLKDATEMLL